MTPLDILAALVLMAGLMFVLERTHRRTSHLPRAPFSADADSEEAFAYRREIAELRDIQRLSHPQC